MYVGSLDCHDAGLEDVKVLTGLEEPWLIETQVTDEGVGKFQQALPDCGIIYSP